MNDWDDSEDKRKERERKERIQHPHIIKSRNHWDNEQAYWDLLKDQTEKMRVITERPCDVEKI